MFKNSDQLTIFDLNTSKTKMKTFSTLLLLLFLAFQAHSQSSAYSRQDSLRGTITAERGWWDLLYYHLDIKVDPENKTIIGSNTIHYKVLEVGKRIQIDLQSPLSLKKAVQNTVELNVTQEGNAYFIDLKDDQKVGESYSLTIDYGGSPKEAKRPPWDGGITWSKDENEIPFIASSCQGLGASVWWPCKDHMYDEPDSMLISVNVPDNLINVSNGRLREVEELDNDTNTWHWFVSNPINNYGVNINIGDYVHFGETYNGEKGELDIDYYVLRSNLEKAKVHFTDVIRMFEAFEHWFGPYPFYEDSYKLVEVPYLGMEHQSSITYGNGYQNGYLGRDLSSTGWGLKFDFIIIHESGHEWFANNITYRDMADMWIHESFTNYSESLYLEYHFGKQAGYEYVRGTRAGIGNNSPIISDYEVNSRGSGDMYPKGGNMLHTLRQLVNDDNKWRQILRGLNEKFYHQTVTTLQVEDYIAQQSGLDLTHFFDQYLRDYRLPVLEYYFKGQQLNFRWSNCNKTFDMPIKVNISGEAKWLNPTSRWSSIKIDIEEPEVKVDPDFYVASFEIAKM